MKTAFKIFIALFLLIGIPHTLCSQDSIPVHDSFKMESKHVGETRVIAVWTPPSYNVGNESFPVLYMPDGGVKEDFPHIANTLAKLVADKSIPPFILVGIENTDRHRDLSGTSQVKKDKRYCPLSDGAKDFREFITDELFQEISKRYRVTEEKGIIGESLAGLFVVETMLLKPESFNFYIAMDPSLWWNNSYLVKNADEILANFSNSEIKLWFAGSQAKDISKQTNNLATLLESNAPKNLKWEFSNEPNEKHHTIFRATKEKALIWTLSK